MSSRKIRSILLIFLISVVGTSILSLFLYNISTNIIKRQIEQQTESSLINLSNRVSNFQDRISQAIIDLQNTQDYEQFISSLPFTDYRSSMLTSYKFVMQLNAIHASLDYVDDITFYSVADGQEYATNGLLNSQLGQFKQEIAKFEEMNVSQALLDTTNNGAPSVVYIQALPMFQSKPQGYLIFHYTPHFLGRVLQNDQGDSNYLIVNEDHQVLDSYSLDGSQRPIRELADSLWDQWVVDGNQQHRALSHQGYFYIMHQPANQTWSYIYAIKESQALAPIIRLRNIVLESTAALLLLSLLLYAFSVNLFWRGWNKIFELVGDGKETSSGDDFDALFRKIQGLMQNQNQLKDRMNEIFPEAKDAFLKQILTKGCGKRDFAKLQQYGLSLDNQPYRCICLEVDDCKTMSNLYSVTDMSYFEYGIACVIREVMAEAGIGGSVIVDNQGSFAGIYASEIKTGAAFDAALTRIKHAIDDYFPFTVTIGVSGPRSDLAHVNLAYIEARESLKQKLIVGPNQVIYFTDAIKRESLFSPDLHEIENEIVHAIRDKNTEFAHIALSRLVEIKRAENIDYRSLQNYLVNMILSLFREFAADQRFINQISVNDMMHLSTLEEWTGWIRTHCIDRLIEDMRHNERKQYEKISKKLVQHVQNHLEEDLRLHEVCKQIGIPVNLANLALKEIHGMTFKDYLFQCRIELSKKWLRETGMNLEEISNLLFYSNAQNFSRAFKKQVGLPPGHYRRQHQPVTEESGA